MPKYKISCLPTQSLKFEKKYYGNGDVVDLPEDSAEKLDGGPIKLEKVGGKPKAEPKPAAASKQEALKEPKKEQPKE